MYDVVSPSYSVADIFGAVVDRESATMHLGFTPTKNFGRYLNSYIKWCGFVHNTVAMFRDWNFALDYVPAIPGQNPIMHTNLIGTVATNGREEYFNKPERLYKVPIVPRSSMFRLRYVSGLVSDVEILEPNAFSGIPGYGELAAIIPDLQNAVSNGEWDGEVGGIGHDVAFRHFQYLNWDDRSPRYISYLMQLTHTDPLGYVYRAVYNYLFSFEYSLLPQIYGGNEEYDLHERVVVKTSLFCTDRYFGAVLYGNEDELANIDDLTPLSFEEFQDWHDEVSVVESGADFAHPIMINDKVSYLTGTAPSGAMIHSSSRSLASFQAMSLGILGDAAPASALSVKDAVDKYFSSMSSNHIETLVEMSDMVRPIDVVKAFYALRNLKKGGVSAVLRLLAFLSDAYLTYAFGVAPTLDDAKDIAKKATALRDRFQGVLRPETVSGKFVYPVPPEFTAEFPEVTLVARTSLRFSVNPDSFLTGMLPLRSLGLLPSLSNLWDVIPWSWAVDWGTHVGASQEDLEASMMMLCLNIDYAVNSLSFHYDFTADDLALAQVAPGPSDNPSGYKFYLRYVGETLPVMAQTRFSFHGTAGVPDWGVVSSLLYRRIT